jgi:hypothetical protein
MSTSQNQQVDAAVQAAESQESRDSAALAAAVERTEIKCNTSGALMPTNLSQMWRLAKYVVASGLAPKSFKTAEQVFVAFAYGGELGVSPMMSLQFFAVVNGKVTIYGDAMPAMAMPVLSSLNEWYEDENGVIDNTKPGWAGRMTAALKRETLVAVCEATRKGFDVPARESFSVDDAKRAGLFGKEGPWRTVPQRMMRWRARSWALRVAAADRLGGLLSAEEARDIRDDDVPAVGISELSARMKAKVEAAKSETPVAAYVPPATAPAPSTDPAAPVEVDENGNQLPPVKF